MREQSDMDVKEKVLCIVTRGMLAAGDGREEARWGSGGWRTEDDGRSGHAGMARG